MKQKDYYINAEGEFVIEDYNRKKPFSSFLPAVSGLYGKPMWAYYVNRGQCMATFGVNNKDYSIMEFQPANKAYRQTSLEGFRTFYKIKKADGTIAFYEPFQNHADNMKQKISQRMLITSYDFKLEDINNELGIKTEVMFATLPGENLPALMRSVTITNIGNADIAVEVLDGMPVIIPYYLINQDMKNESNLRQAWMSADTDEGLAFYRIKALPYDTVETVLLEGGNFYLNFQFDGDTMKRSQTIVDPSLVFGNITDMTYPEVFMRNDFTVPTEQANVGYTPCGFSYQNISLSANADNTTYTLIGSAPSFDSYKAFLDSRIKAGYMETKIEENKTIIEQTKRHIFTASSSDIFDQYCGQTFMDNYLRGGYPEQTGNGKHVLYVYSRKHGDLEREYNFFQVDSTNYSQGNANFRDVNQNRRNDVYFFPYVGDSVIKIFFNILQLDGFNPLVLNGSRFAMTDQEACTAVISSYFGISETSGIVKYLEKAFTPGALLLFIEQQGYSFKGSIDSFVNDLLELCEKEDVATFQEGYWVDHWTYNNDLLEQYLAVFPDKVKEAMFQAKDYTYYDNDEIVVPRTQRYVLTENGIRQYGALKKIAEKTKLIQARDNRPNQVRKQYGTGEVYHCSLASKLLLLLVNKAASLDPEGVGLEMEGNKPGWCDALNGLPGILGSSINESAEVVRLAKLMKQLLAVAGEEEIALPVEAKQFYDTLLALITSNATAFEYWGASNDAKEAYREAVVFGIDGAEATVTAAETKIFLDAVITQLEKGLQKAYNTATGVYDTYFINEVSAYETMTDKNGEVLKNDLGMPYVRATAFKQRAIPPFLEGQVHMMRSNHAISGKLHEAVKKSGIYDEKLDMFKVNADIMDETKEIGRQNVFPRGWLENEAVFLHMEYKYFLELLRSGLYDEFSHYLQKAFIPFLDPAVYGRSTLENCSFIASSAHPDERIHGAGYVSRLTGASTELLHIWRLMTVGENPFLLDENGELCMELVPQIPSWLFTENEKTAELYTATECREQQIPANAFGFMILGHTPAVYRNDSRCNTYDSGVGVVGVTLYRDGKEVATFKGNRIPAPYAQELRDGKIDYVEAIISATV